jgi:GR25 family glycosyltransferase involved in LPS biosynthesis
MANKFELEVYVINLVRRKDRLAQFLGNFSINVRVLPAFDGINLGELQECGLVSDFQFSMVAALKKWPHNPESMVPALFGCWQSHISIWQTLVASSDVDKKILVFEDDVLGATGFEENLSSVIGALPIDFDLAYLGGQNDSGFMRDALEYSEIIETEDDDGNSHSWGRLDSGKLNTTSAYVISKGGAIKLLNYLSDELQNVGELEAIDGFMKTSSNFMKNFELRPHLFYSSWNSPESDIRFRG